MDHQVCQDNTPGGLVPGEPKSPVDFSRRNPQQDVPAKEDAIPKSVSSAVFTRIGTYLIKTEMMHLNGLMT